MAKKFANKIRKSKLDLNSVNKLKNIFTTKKWDEFDEYEQVFERFCLLFKLLSKDQKNLIFELIDRYYWINSSKYIFYISNLLSKIEKKFFEDTETVFVLPVNDRAEETKSGNVMAYFLKTLSFSYNEKYNNVFFDISDNIDLLRKKYDSKSPIILIDDFIGTGNSIKNTLKSVLSEISNKKENIKVLTIVVMNKGLNLITDLGIEVVYSILAKKGISDYYLENTLSAKLSIMDTIENKIKMLYTYKYGYEMSEALVTMSRTPDNTFPVFWKEILIGNKIYIAPFQRDQFDEN